MKTFYFLVLSVLTFVVVSMTSCSPDNFSLEIDAVNKEIPQKSNTQQEYTTSIITSNNQLIHELLDDHNKPYVYVITVDCMGEGEPQEAFWTFVAYGYGTGEDGRLYMIKQTIAWSNITQRVETTYQSVEITASEYDC